MENLFPGAVSIPLYQMMILLAIMTVALLFGYLRSGLFLCYIFVFYWGNMFSIRSVFDHTDPNTAALSFVFIGFGLIIVFLAMLGFLLNRE